MPPNLTDRIALQLVNAAARHMRSDAIRMDARGQVTSSALEAAISQLTLQLAKQGLSPGDLDRPEGRDALDAIAAAMLGKRFGKGSNDLVAFPYLALPDEWKHVVNVAHRHADRFVRHVTK